ncbi:GTP cyclohydrolase [Rhizobium sp. Root149]|nr:GTP cyclohydrolase [Rhizobium sp. Root149]
MIMTEHSPFALEFKDPSREVERAVAELRFGRPIILEDRSRALAVLALDAVSPALYDQFASVVGQKHELFLTRNRAEKLGITRASDIVAPLRNVSFHQASELAYTPGTKRLSAWRKANELESASAELASTALLLPAMVCAEVERDDKRFSSCCTLDHAQLSASSNVRQSFQIVARTPVPLETFGYADFVVFRGGLAQKDQVAIVVGKPDVSKPVPIRIHSSCITGDLCGSLKCDCGDQLRNGLDLLAKAGGGVLLYLDQEGRGTGIGAKMRAYGFQHRGMDTIDADAQLGFGADHRRYEAAVAMLKLLNIDEVIVYTNNPTKIAALSDAGILVHARSAVTGRVTSENEFYLRTKTARAGHMLDVDALIAAE